MYDEVIGLLPERVIRYRDELRKYGIESEPMSSETYLDILWQDLWNEDWKEINSDIPCPIFRDHATMDEVLDVIDPDRRGSV